MASPVFTPGGQCSVRKPHNSTIPADQLLKLGIQMLSLPSTEAVQGAARPLPDTGEKDASVPSARNTVMLPPDSYPGVCPAKAGISTLVALAPASGSPSKLNLNAASISPNFKAPRGELPSLLVIQTLPWLSTARPLAEYPTLKVSTLLGSEAGKRTTWSAMAFVIQMRSC